MAYNRKKEAEEYLANNIEIKLDLIEKLKQQPQSQIDFMGGVAMWYRLTGCSSYYQECVAAIKHAGYKNPDSDRTWETVTKLKDKVVAWKLAMLGY